MIFEPKIRCADLNDDISACSLGHNEGQAFECCLRGYLFYLSDLNFF